MVAVVDITAIREALAAAAESLGLYAYAYPPMAPAVGPDGTFIVAEPDSATMITYHVTGDGAVDIVLMGQVLVGSIMTDDSQKLLDRYRGTGHAKSLADAIDAAITAGNTADAVTVADFGPLASITYGDAATGGVVLFGAQATIRIYA